MVHSGDLVITRKGLYAPSGELNLIRGYFEAHGDGYGFVIPDVPGARDLFIPPPATGGAMDNDRVIARIEPPGRKGRIIRVLERAHKFVAGTVEVSKNVCFVKPKSKAVQFDIYIPPAEAANLESGLRVVAEITEYPSDKRRPPTGRIARLIKQPDQPREEVQSVIDEFSLPRKFPKAVAQEAGALGKRDWSLRMKKEPAREDLRALTTVTIDGEKAKDFDDAVSIRVTELGYTLWVHIADVSHFVRPGSHLDKEASERGTSVYFPDMVLPMLPRELSEDLCSLVPGKERLAFTAEMQFDRFGKRFGAKFYPSLIISDRRMTYTEVAGMLEQSDSALTRKYECFYQDFELMSELASSIRQRRLARGSLDFDLPEPEILLDMQGRPEAVVKSERNVAHIIIEEFMIAANEAVAEYLEGRGIPSLYRIHEKPDPEKIEGILRTARLLMKKKIPRVVSDLQGLLNIARGTPGEEVINYLVLRSLKQARYSTINAGHFGLASESYTHFTSPIRRYPDLVVHRILREAIAGAITPERSRELKTILPDIAFSCSRTERAADEAERAVMKALKAWFMRDKTGDVMSGVIIGVTSYGLRVRLRDYYVEGFLHVSVMTDDFYIFNEETLSLHGKRGRQFSMGDPIQVRLDKVDMEEKEILFGLAG
jgi:ribonuclease R